MSNDWIKWNGGERPVVAGTRVDAIFRNGMTRTSTADDFNWTYRADSTDEADIVSYRISDMRANATNGQDQSPQMVKTNPLDSGKPCLCFPGQCRGQVVDGKQPNGDRCKQDYAKSDEAWFDWDTSTLPTSPALAGGMKMEWQLISGHVGVGEARDPVWYGGPHRVVKYRWTDPRVMVLNPYTGQKRNAVDIMHDPEGRFVQLANDMQTVSQGLCAAGESTWKEVGEALRYVPKPAPWPEAPRAEIINDPAQIEAAFERDQEADDTVTLRLPNDVANCLKATAEASGQSLDDVVSEALRRDIEASFVIERTERVGDVSVTEKFKPKSMQYDEATIESKFVQMMSGIATDLKEPAAALRNLSLTEGCVDQILNRLHREPRPDEYLYPHRIEVKALGDRISDDEALHVVRNPFGWAEDSVRRARQLLADRFEKVKKQRDEMQKLRDTTVVTIKPTAEWEDLVRRDQAAIGTLMALGYEWKGGEQWAPPIGMAPPFKAHELLDQARNHMKARAATYDKPEGERSMGATVEAFNAITGRDLRESEGWLLMTLLKLVRSETRDAPHRDSVEDLIAYSGLYGEARLSERVVLTRELTPEEEAAKFKHN